MSVKWQGLQRQLIVFYLKDALKLIFDSKTLPGFKNKTLKYFFCFKKLKNYCFKTLRQSRTSSSALIVFFSFLNCQLFPQYFISSLFTTLFLLPQYFSLLRKLINLCYVRVIYHFYVGLYCLDYKNTKINIHLLKLTIIFVNVEIHYSE